MVGKHSIYLSSRGKDGGREGLIWPSLNERLRAPLVTINCPTGVA